MSATSAQEQVAGTDIAPTPSINTGLVVVTMGAVMSRRQDLPAALLDVSQRAQGPLGVPVEGLHLLRMREVRRAAHDVVHDQQFLAQATRLAVGEGQGRALQGIVL